jgi:hypothetical protein
VTKENSIKYTYLALSGLKGTDIADHYKPQLSSKGKTAVVLNIWHYMQVSYQCQAAFAILITINNCDNELINPSPEKVLDKYKYKQL